MSFQRLSSYFLLPTFYFLLLGCQPSDIKDTLKRSDTYEQNFKSDVAWVVLEWNGKPKYGGWGSGFLVDRKRGAFYTNKHVGDMFDALGEGSHKIFFNGKVYNAAVVKTHLLVDVALVRITDPFDPSEFPEPAPIATEAPRVGDKVWVEGFHPHPYRVREADESEGFKFPRLSIFRDYYKIPIGDIEKEQEIVFERLEAVVEELDKNVPIGDQGSGFVQEIRNKVNLYMYIKTLKDHRFSFGGLSGTVVRNRAGETVGIFTAGPEVEYDKDTAMPLEGGLFIAQRVYKTGAITPIKAVNDLKKYLN